MNRVRRYAILTAVCVPVAFLLSYGVLLWQDETRRGAVRAEQPPRRSSFRPDEFRPFKALRRPMPAIVDPPTVSAEKARGRLDDGELVLAVEIDGQPRAYPINMLTGPSREIFNDQLGGRAIAATW